MTCTGCRKQKASDGRKTCRKCRAKGRKWYVENKERAQYTGRKWREAKGRCPQTELRVFIDMWRIDGYDNVLDRTRQRAWWLTKDRDSYWEGAPLFLRDFAAAMRSAIESDLKFVDEDRDEADHPRMNTILEYEADEYDRRPFDKICRELEDIDRRLDSIVSDHEVFSKQIKIEADYLPDLTIKTRITKHVTEALPWALEHAPDLYFKMIESGGWDPTE